MLEPFRSGCIAQRGPQLNPVSFGGQVGGIFAGQPRRRRLRTRTLFHHFVSLYGWRLEKDTPPYHHGNDLCISLLSPARLPPRLHDALDALVAADVRISPRHQAFAVRTIIWRWHFPVPPTTYKLL
ncbi:uncharacterized protein SEPMUDRAFT_114927 [Sphaerulina musiva SO2202]|uniref:Uncharacterized protein n=1 Tax=Sphaerulina musiva (strain SO2202) TaxID=692275 RepID=M3DDG2_SPHMS|nr:uncharacterized protein SEPMUDRAFT_114927 [Sphaerulina musiva SO2202]EMF15859.1 hypothetical protein SEPMUDRAFT_114927 [Sphaerulina musiva SO2202]